jgi:hypothetical protein
MYETVIEELPLLKTTYARLQALGIKLVKQIPDSEKELKKLGFTKRQIRDLIEGKGNLNKRTNL